MRVDAARVIERRRAERRDLIDRARQVATELDARFGLRAVVVFGSVARGDFNVWSDIDVLVVADGLPDRTVERDALLGSVPHRVQALMWTPEEYVRQLARRNPIAVEANERGVWLVGSAVEVVTRARRGA